MRVTVQQESDDDAGREQIPFGDEPEEPDELDEEDIDESEDEFPGQHHVEFRTIILPNRKIVFVPMLKAGCTSLLWMLAQVAGFTARRFEKSSLGAVSPAMTIHTMSAWPDPFRWCALTDEQKDAIAVDDAWLRFTTVRDPATRLWSAWQSKLLLREPGFTRRFGDQEWFPRIPANPHEVVEDFRAFVHSLVSDNPPYDAHWAPQTDFIAAAPPLNHVGRLESLDETVHLVEEHLGPGLRPLAGEQENRSLLRYDRALYDDETAGLVNSYYANDFTQLGYEPLTSSPDAAALDRWSDGTAGRLDAIGALCGAHARIEELHKQAKTAKRRRLRVKELEVENARLESWIDAAADRAALRTS